MHHDFLAQQHPIIVPPHLLEVDKALFQLRDDEADLVHVRGKHKGRSWFRICTSL